MDREALKAKARLLDAQTRQQMEEPFFQDTLAWFTYLGLLRHNTIVPRRTKVTLADALRAGEIEPRVLELLPALMVACPQALSRQDDDVPADLSAVVAAIKRRAPPPAFRGVPAQKYLHWLSSPAIVQAGKRLHYRSLPRARTRQETVIGSCLARERLARGLTQKQFVELHGLSLRVVRDLEQGKMTASFQSVIDVLKAIDKTLEIV